MTITLLDFSQRLELTSHANIVADIEAAAAPHGIVTLIAGAFARDLHLLYRFGIETRRQTEDLDFALATPDWAAYMALKKQLIASGTFSASATAIHRLRHQNHIPVDLVPFGQIETSQRKIVWPPRSEVVMDVFGFREALVAANDVLLPGNVKTKVVSLPALALLKIVCWQDRHYEAPRKDAHDLNLILCNYLDAGNEHRLWDEFLNWTQEDSFQYELVGARMLGYDIRALLDEKGVARINAILSEQADPNKPARLPNEMATHEPDNARLLLHAMLNELLKSRHR